MRKSVFSKDLFVEALRRSRVVLFIFAGLMILSQFITPLISGLSEMQDRAFIAQSGAETIGVTEICAPMIIYTLILAPVMMLVVFNAFDRRNSSDFYQSLPYTRICIAFTWSLSVIITCAVFVITGCALGYMSYVFFPDVYILNTAGLWDIMLSFLAASVFAVGSLLIAVSVTGTVLSNIVTALLVIYLPRILLVIEKEIITQRLSNLVEWEYFASFLNVDWNVYVSGPFSILSSAYYGTYLGSWIGNWGKDLYTLALGLAYFALGIWLFNRRKSETAGTSASSRTVQAVIRIALTFTVSTIGTMLLAVGNYSFIAVTAIIMYVLALIVFFAYEIITTKKWKNLVKAMPSLLIVVALNLIMVIAAFFSRGAVLNRTVTAEQIDSVSVISYGYNRTIVNYNQLYWNETEIGDDSVKKIVSEALYNDIEAIRNNRYVYAYYDRPLIRISTSSGVFYRTLRMSSDQYDILVRALLNSEQYRENVMTLPAPDLRGMQISCGTGFSWLCPEPDEAAELYDIMQGEINAAGDKWLDFISESDSYSSEAIYLYVPLLNDAMSSEVSIPVSAALMPETVKYVMNLCISSQGDRYEIRSELKTFIDVIENLDYRQTQNGYYNFDIEIYSLRDDGGYDYDYRNYSDGKDSGSAAGFARSLMKIAGNDITVSGSFVAISFDGYCDGPNDGSELYAYGRYIIPVPDGTTFDDLTDSGQIT